MYLRGVYVFTDSKQTDGQRRMVEDVLQIFLPFLFLQNLVFNSINAKKSSNGDFQEKSDIALALKCLKTACEEIAFAVSVFLCNT